MLYLPADVKKEQNIEMKKFTLYWKSIKIGILTETDWDMRSSGNIEYKYHYLNEDHKNSHLSNYIKHSIQAIVYLESGDELNYNRMCKEETRFIDLINGTEWRIVDKDDKSHKILCPVFCEDNGITWQKTYDDRPPT